MKEFIVASASPRRKEILENAGYSFKVIPSEADENVREKLNPEKLVILLAERKAISVSKNEKDAVVLGCDTVVSYGDEVLGKPKNEEDAKRMLKLLSEKTHKVSTGVCITDGKEKESFCVTTEVEFYPLSEQTIDSYIKTGEAYDKAGSYGIQGYGAVLVKKIKGDYFSVMGLPISETARALKKFGIKGKVEL